MNKNKASSDAVADPQGSDGVSALERYQRGEWVKASDFAARPRYPIKSQKEMAEIVARHLVQASVGTDDRMTDWRAVQFYWERLHTRARLWAVTALFGKIIVNGVPAERPSASVRKDDDAQS